MKLRRIAGALLTAAALAACKGSAVEPAAVRAGGPSLDRQAYPPGIVGNPHVPFDTSDIHTGYFGSGHREPPSDTTIVD